MNNLVIRKATSSDIRKIAALRLLLQQHCEESNPSVWRITEEGEGLLKQRVENALMDSNVHVLVADVNGEVIGFVQGEATHRSDYLPKSVGSVSAMYVIKKFRRKGVGRRMTKELCEFFNSKGVEHLTLRYIIGNKEAERFWRKLGFESILTTAGTPLKELDSKLKTMGYKGEKL